MRTIAAGWAGLALQRAFDSEVECARQNAESSAPKIAATLMQVARPEFHRSAGSPRERAVSRTLQTQHPLGICIPELPIGVELVCQ
jgi:hypothetical protein